MGTSADALDTLGEVKAEIAEVRRRVDPLIWGTGFGFVAVAAMWVVFRYVG